MMAKRQLSLVLVSTIALLGVACGGGETPQADTPPQPPVDAKPAPTETTPPPATTEAAPAPTQAAPTPAPEQAAPAPKPGKERMVGQWQFDFSGEPRTAAEADAKKKAGKDEKKFAALMKEYEDAAAGEWIEFTADSMYVSHITEKGKDKVILKVKYEVTKDEAGTVVMKPAGKDEISKKEMPKDLEITILLKDDKTLEMKDPKKKMTLVFKRKS